MNSRFATIFLSIVCISFLGGCDVGPKSAVGFRLPDGDPDTGKQLFVELQCNSCHTVPGLQFSPAVEGPVKVVLGGPVARVKNYGQLVTSIINPSHKLAPRYDEEEVSREGESLMRNYNEVLTVQQLIDLVAFLQAEYDVMPPQTSYYSYQ